MDKNKVDSCIEDFVVVDVTEHMDKQVVNKEDAMASAAANMQAF